MKVVSVSSIDFDGCLNHGKTIQKMEDYISMNAVLMSFINNPVVWVDKEAAFAIKFQKRIFVGSARQSISIDSGGSSSAFMAIDYVSNQLGAQFDRLTLSDIHTDQRPGHFIDLFLSAIEQKGYKDQVIFENLQLALLVMGDYFDSPYSFSQAFDKIDMIYAQTQKVASEHPDDLIVFDFFDDRIDILTNLYIFFDKHPALLPANLKLRLFKYKSQELSVVEGLKQSFLGDPDRIKVDSLSTNISSIQGKGAIDVHYYQTVKNMIAIGERFRDVLRKSEIELLKCVTPERLNIVKTQGLERALAETETQAKAIAGRMLQRPIFVLHAPTRPPVRNIFQEPSTISRPD